MARTTGGTVDSLEAVRQGLSDLGLSPYEARVVAALMQGGAANSTTLARLAGVPRTSTYQVIDSLLAKGLAERVPGPGPAVWSCPGRDDIFERLEAAVVAANAERLRQHKACSAKVRELVDNAFSEVVPASLPSVHVLSCPVQIRTRYERLVASASSEVLVCNRPPYWAVADESSSVIAEALARGVAMRVLYQAAQVEPPEAEAFRAAVAAYEAAGVASRVVDELPAKLVVVDGKVAMVGMNDPTAVDGRGALTVVVDNPGYAGLQVSAFEALWATARPLPAVLSPIAGADASD